MEGVEAQLGSVPVDACHEQFRRTALHWAAENGDVGLCEVRGEARVNPNPNRQLAHYIEPDCLRGRCPSLTSALALALTRTST